MPEKARAFRQTLEDQKIKNVHAILEDIRMVASYIDAQTGDLSTIPESDLVTAIKCLTDEVKGLKNAIEQHTEDIPKGIEE